MTEIKCTEIRMENRCKKNLKKWKNIMCFMKVERFLKKKLSRNYFKAREIGEKGRKI